MELSYIASQLYIRKIFQIFCKKDEGDRLIWKAILKTLPVEQWAGRGANELG
jgi:hypothetical protein